MKINDAGIRLLKEFEGCKLTSYKDSVGIWTIGYGLTSAAHIVDVKQGMTITQAQAEQYLRQALGQYEEAVHKGTTHEPNPNQNAAMVSLCYNIGPGNFAKSSVLREFNAKNFSKAAAAFLSWNKAGGKVLVGLSRRRQAEKKLFET